MMRKWIGCNYGPICSFAVEANLICIQVLNLSKGSLYTCSVKGKKRSQQNSCLTNRDILAALILVLCWCFPLTRRLTAVLWLQEAVGQGWRSSWPSVRICKYTLCVWLTDWSGKFPTEGLVARVLPPSVGVMRVTGLLLSRVLGFARHQRVAYVNNENNNSNNTLVAVRENWRHQAWHLTRGNEAKLTSCRLQSEWQAAHHNCGFFYYSNWWFRRIFLVQTEQIQQVEK